MKSAFGFKHIAWLLGALATGMPASAAWADATTADSSFGTNGRVQLTLGGSNNTGLTVVQQSGTGKLVVGGRLASSGSGPLAHVTRLNTDGTVDTTFATAGTYSVSFGNAFDETVQLAQQDDGKLLAVVSTGHVVRLSANGVLDSSYAGDGIADITAPVGLAGGPSSAALQPTDGKLVVLAKGFTGSPSLFRLNTDGTLDTGFGQPGTPGFATLATTGAFVPFEVAVQTDGKILVVGTSDANIGVGGDMVVLRLGADGSPDTSFDSDGRVSVDFSGFYDAAYAVLRQPDGKIVVAGEAGATSSRPDCALVRFNPDGSLDAGFGTGGKGRFVRDSLSVCNSLRLMSDGRFIAMGRWQPSIARYYLALRITAAGQDDPTFDNGAWFEVYDFPPSLGNDPSEGIVQADGKIVIAGTVDGLRSGVLRLQITANVPNQFTFVDQTNVARSTTVTSNTVTITGLTAATSISVSGGEYSINGGTFTSAAGTINNNATLQVRHTSSASFSTATNTTLAIAGVFDVFTSTTLAPDTQPDVFAFIDQTGVGPSTLVVSAAITVAGINSPAPISVTGGEYSVNGGAFTTAAGTVSSGDSVRVRHTSSASLGATVNTTLSIGGVTDVFSSTSVAPDNVPNAFSFTDQSSVARSTAVTSAAITVSGTNVPAPIGVTGGEYAINGGAFTSAAGTVNPGDTVQARHTSSASFATATDTVVTIGGVVDTFTSTTLAADTTPDAFTLTAQTGVALGAQVTSNAITIAGINAPANITISGGTYAINGGAYTSAAGTVVSGDSVTVRLTASSSNNTVATATLTIGGVSGAFNVTTEQSAAPPVVKKKGGGSFSGWSLVALGLMMARRARRVRLN
jgi:uncharacterized delta-60 repeat protein